MKHNGPATEKVPYSPLKNYYGYDKTFVKRMSLADYKADLRNSEKQQCGVVAASSKTCSTQQRRLVLHSRDPSVSFSSPYPMYDERDGRELCVSYQAQDRRVELELSRLQSKGEACRRSAVRLSADLGGDAPRPMCEDPLLESDPLDVSVSRMSSFPSQPVSARPSEFSIYHDSRSSCRPVLVSSSAAGQQQEGGGAAQRAVLIKEVLMPPSVMDAGKENTHIGDDEGYPVKPSAEQQPAGGLKRPRVNSVPRLSRVRFADDNPPPQQQSTSRPRSLTPPLPLQPQQPTTTTTMGASDITVAEQEEEMRFTLAAMRASGLRTTKQLFRPTEAGGRATTTAVSHAQLIPSSLYGVGVSTIRASLVHEQVEDNFSHAAALLGVFEKHKDKQTPEVRCGQVIALGDRWFVPVSFFPSAEVYAVMEVAAPQQQQQQQSSTSDGEKGEEKASPTRASDADGGEAITISNPQQIQSSAQIETPKKAGTPPPPPSYEPLHTDAPQMLLYRWRVSRWGGNEAHRAAIGLSLVCPAEVAAVTGFQYADGGLTLLTLPRTFRVVPLSGLPLHQASFSTLLKVVLKMLSGLLVRRTVHGSLLSLGDILLAYSTGAGDGGGAAQGAPLLLPVHWERMIDFSMFADRNAGRSVLYDMEDAAASSSEELSVSGGKDVGTVLLAFLQHALAAAMQADEYLMLQRLICMASEATSVANFTLMTNNLMFKLTTDLPALQHAYNCALPTYT